MKITKNKINIFYYLSIILFLGTCFYLWNNNKAYGVGTDVGTHRILSILTPNFGCPGQPPSPHGCLCGNMDVTFDPSAGGGPYVQGPALCMSPSLAAQTVGPPITPASVGYQLLGKFMTLIPVAVPIGQIGTSLGASF